MKTGNILLPLYFPESWAQSYGQDTYGLWQGVYLGDIEIRFRWMPPGSFMMGSLEDEPERFDKEGPLHKVSFADGFWLAETACTQELWLAVMGKNPSNFSDDIHNSVEKVSWYDVQEFIKKLNGMVNGLEARLPSEAEWEYGCRAGTTTPFWFGDRLTSELANYDGRTPYNGGDRGEYREKTVPVKRFQRNPWGLYQMHGNIWEWCEDRWHDSYNDAPIDGRAWREGSDYDRVLRGGSWSRDGRDLRSACRNDWLPDGRSDDGGFRLARGPQEQQKSRAR